MTNARLALSESHALFGSKEVLSNNEILVSINLMVDRLHVRYFTWNSEWDILKIAHYP